MEEKDLLTQIKAIQELEKTRYEQGFQAGYVQHKKEIEELKGMENIPTDEDILTDEDLKAHIGP